jgi:hypothetical protein
MWIHGGGWVLFDLDTYDASCRGLADKTGAVVVSPDYRRAPEAVFPASHDDVLAAFRWVRQNAASFGGDPDRVAIGGESVGGTMAAATCLQLAEAGERVPAAQVCVYPLTTAEQHGPRSAALVSLLVYNGLRIAEVLATDIEHFTHQRGHRVLRIVRKGGKASTEPLAPIVLRALETYVGERTTGPLFLNTAGTARMSYSIAYKLIRRLATRAAIPSAHKISPHSLRHSFATELLAAGVPLQDVQDAMGHADPRTTRAYDRSRHNLDRHPTYTMAAQLHRTMMGTEGARKTATSSGDNTMPTTAAKKVR